MFPRGRRCGPPGPFVGDPQKMISNAYAQAAPAATPGGDLMGFLPIILMFVILYFLMIRPQMKRAKEHKAMLEGLQKGDEVIAMGLLGKVAKVGDGYISLEIADSVTVQVQKQAVTTLLPKGTLNDAK
jgi:preprotein translocase subunit YajC